VCGRAALAIRPAFGERQPRDFDATVPTMSPPEAQRAWLEDAGDAEPEPRLRACLQDAGAAESELQAAPRYVCGRTHRYRGISTLLLAPGKPTS
jgi:hypothetical protein